MAAEVPASKIKGVVWRIPFGARSELQADRDKRNPTMRHAARTTSIYLLPPVLQEPEEAA